jgi:hypothetical protein
VDLGGSAAPARLQRRQLTGGRAGIREGRGRRRSRGARRCSGLHAAAAPAAASCAPLPGRTPIASGSAHRWYQTLPPTPRTRRRRSDRGARDPHRAMLARLAATALRRAADASMIASQPAAGLWRPLLPAAPRARRAAASATAGTPRAFVAADRPPAAPGDPLARVDTPALLLDLDGAPRRLGSRRAGPQRPSLRRAYRPPSRPRSASATAPLGRPARPLMLKRPRARLAVVEANCRRLREAMAGYPSVAIRPHAKVGRGGAGARGRGARMRQSNKAAETPPLHLPPDQAHKCPELAALQLKLLGPQAVGVCAQKVGRRAGRQGTLGPRPRRPLGLAPPFAPGLIQAPPRPLLPPPPHPLQVSEAEALVAGGVADVLVSNQVVAPAKLERLAALAATGELGGAARARLGAAPRALLADPCPAPQCLPLPPPAPRPGARVGVCVDAAAALRALASAAARAGAVVDVLVEVNAGQDRWGRGFTRLVLVACPALACGAAAAWCRSGRGVRRPGRPRRAPPRPPAGAALRRRARRRRSPRRPRRWGRPAAFGLRASRPTTVGVGVGWLGGSRAKTGSGVEGRAPQQTLPMCSVFSPLSRCAPTHPCRRPSPRRPAARARPFRARRGRRPRRGARGGGRQGRARGGARVRNRDGRRRGDVQARGGQRRVHRGAAR